MSKDTARKPSFALPHAPSTEQSVLASSLIDSRYWPLAESLDADPESLFYEPTHRQVASAMHRLHQAGRTINEDAVVDMLRVMGTEIDGGARNFLVEISIRASARSQTEFKDQLSALGEQRALRNITTEADKISERARSGNESPAELAEAMLTVSEHGRSSNEPIKRFGEYIDSMDSTVSYRVPTGLTKLNQLIGGWEAGRIYAIAARPKVGKTTLALNAVVNALSDGAAVLMFSLEMPRRELYGKLLACTAFVPLSDVNDYLNKKMSLEDFPPDQGEDLTSAIDQVRQAPLYIVETGEVRSGIHDVLAAVVDVKSRLPEGQPLIVFVDYLQLLVRNAMDAASEITNITRELKLLAARLDVPIVLLSQINRSGAESNDEGMPSPHQMKGSGSIEQDADVTILLNRRALQDDDASPNDMDIWVALSRYSGTGFVKAYYSPAEQTIADPSGDGEAPDRSGGDPDDERQSSRPAGARSAKSRRDSDEYGDEDDYDDGLD